MRRLRFIAYAALLLIIVVVTAVTMVIRNQAAIAQIALGRIHERTGLDIQITGTRIALGSHLVVVLEHPRVLSSGVEIARLKDIRAVLGYRAILRHNGLPLHRLVLDEPRAKLPANSANVTAGGIAHFDAAAATVLLHALNALSDTVQHADVVDGVLADENDAPIIEHLNLRAHRSHYRHSGNWPWLVDFDATPGFAVFKPFRLAGSLTLGSRTDQPRLVSSGHLRFWSLRFDSFDLGAVNASAEMNGDLDLAIDNEGVLSGSGETDVRTLSLSGRRLNNVLKLGNYAIVTSYRASPQELSLPKVTIREGSSNALIGSASIARPYDADRTMTFSVGGPRLALANVASWLRGIRGVPPELLQSAARFTSGELALSQVALDTAQPVRDWSIATLRANLRAAATATNVGYQFPAEARLKPLKSFAGQFTYAAGHLRLTQGSLEVGGSRFDHLSAEANLKRASSLIPYKLELEAGLDLAEAYPAAASLIRAAAPSIADRVTNLGGHARITLTESGNLHNFSWSVPHEYLATLDVSQATLSMKDPTADIVFQQGSLTLKPGVIAMNHVRVLPVGAGHGEVILNGSIEPRTGVPVMHNFTVEMHALAIEQWLPLFVPPQDLAADGLIGGVLTANTAPGHNDFPVISGKLTLGAGHLQLGFLRSPIVTRSPTLMLDGKGLTLDMPASKIEGQPLDFRLAVADLAHPEVRIDATAAKLDFEVLRFIRAPWSPHTPPHFFAVPIAGHVEAREANYEKLPLSRVATDFTKAGNDWRVYNFTATVLQGDVHLEITGRSLDDWIRMVGTIAGMDAGQLSTLASEKRPPTVTGKISANGDLWAHTDVDFFSSLAGVATVRVNDGVLSRLTLLSRILALINLKSWLTAQFPDPRVAGLPFKMLTADLTGTGGDFKTDNLRLDGPVMDITAQGDADFGREQLDMDVGVFPFNTANWIVHQIPIIGGNLAGGTQGLVAAYFHVYGPFKNPWIIPKPITSVTQFVKKMLGLPINIIVPGTIK
jgi:AsmA-like protein